MALSFLPDQVWIPEAFRDWPLLTSLASLAVSTFRSAQPDQGLPQCSTSLLTSSPLSGTLCPPPFHWLTTTYSLGPSLKATSSWKPSGTARLCWAPLFSVPSVPCISIIRHLSFHFLFSHPSLLLDMLSVRAQSRLSHLPLSQKVPDKCLNE